MGMMQAGKRPEVGLAEATRIVIRHFGLQVAAIEQLRSHCGRNFHVHSFPRTKCDGEKLEFVLKIMPCIEAENIDIQLKCMKHMGMHGFVCPTPVVNIDGNEYLIYRCESDQQQCVVYMLIFIHGQEVQKNMTTEVIFNVGMLIAEVQNSLESFRVEIPVESPNVWSLSSVPLLEEYLEELDTDAQRDLIKQVLRKFESNSTHFQSLKKGWIHGDMHDDNILLLKSDANEVAQRYAVIDFGDIGYSCAVFDLMIAMAVFMMNVPTNKGEFLKISGHILAGYLSKKQLNTQEQKVLFVAILGRYAQELVLCTIENKYQKEENCYLSMTFDNAWPQLEFMLSCGEEFVYKTWLDVQNMHTQECYQ